MPEGLTTLREVVSEVSPFPYGPAGGRLPMGEAAKCLARGG